jgi:tetratricopeptide (TPR) repeat protein
VRYVLEGSVQLAGDAVRVNAQLIDAESDTQMWADHFDGDRSDVFLLQDQITEQIVTAIAPEITRGEMRRTARARPRDLAAWELVLRAQALILEGTYESQTEARGLLQDALELEPEYALAYARLAEIGHDASNNLSREFGNAAAVAALDEALVLSRRAVQLAPALVEARIWYGHLLLHHRQVSEGLVELREAVRLNPSHAQAHAELGFGLAIQGMVEEATQQFEIAFRLSPNDPRNDRIRTFQALAHLYAGNAGEAARSARRVIDTQPGSPIMLVASVVEISALVRLDRLDDARQKVAEFERFYGELDWPAIARGAWSEDELDRVEADVRAVGMLRH